MTLSPLKPNLPPYPLKPRPAPLKPKLVVSSARELLSPGPIPTPRVAEQLVSELREAAETSVDLVLSAMRLGRAWEDQTRNRTHLTAVHIVDRMGWVSANADTFAQLAHTYLPEPQFLGPAPIVRMRARAQRTSASVELGSVLAILARRVYGQFDVLGTHNRLLLVAPNIYQAEQRLDLTPRDFRLWVALHETTHRVQFAAAPWLRGHILSLIETLLASSEAPLRAGLQNLQNPAASEQSNGLASRQFGTPGRITQQPADLLVRILKGESLVDLITTDHTRAVLDDITAVMSLLEGHAEVMMDTVGRNTIASVARIRRIFNRTRALPNGPKHAAAKLLGLSDKMEQYSQGAHFVRHIVRARGHTGLASVFASPENLPRVHEIAHPAAWLKRVPKQEP